MIINDHALDHIYGMVIFTCSRAILVAVTLECSVKTTGTLASSADPDQTPQNAASDQGLHFLFKLQEVQDLIK